MKSILHIILFFICCKFTTAVYYDISNANATNYVGYPLYLTPYIEQGRIEEAQERARVRHHALIEMESYAGYITINKTHNSNTFFWFFPSKSNPKDDPVILWFIGGPHITVFVAVFAYNGPLTFTSQYIVESRNYTLTVNHSVIYIDNPVGTGFSFTEHDDGYARTQADVAGHAIEFLRQFYKMFPTYYKNDLFLGGDSYGGKFVATTGNTIRKMNEKGQLHFNLKGLMLGNGLIDTANQGIRNEFLYQVGLIDKKQKDFLKIHDDKVDSFNYLQNLTGFTYNSNILYWELDFIEWYQSWIPSTDFRRAVHVGDKYMNFTAPYAKTFYEYTSFNPATKQLEEMLQHGYKVLVYNGQLDFVFPYTASQNFYETFNWTGVEAYRNAERQQWWLDGELAGYVKIAKNFHDVLVRNAGHVTFFEQPKWSCELFTHFTHNKPIVQEGPKEPSNSPGYSYNILC